MTFIWTKAQIVILLLITIPNLVKITSNLKVSQEANFLDMTLKFLTQYFECILIVK